jgi:hypothetical protein
VITANGSLPPENPLAQPDQARYRAQVNPVPNLTTSVPLDAELQVAYDAYLAEEPDEAPMSLERLPGIRAEVDAAVASITDLTFGGRFTFSEPSAPGLDDAPEIPLLVCTPVGAAASRPALYFLHGGGFFCNDHRIGLGR